MSGVNLALCAVNLAEAAGNAVSRGMMAEVYATAGVTTRLHFPASLQIVTVSSALNFKLCDNINVGVHQFVFMFF